MPEKYHILIVEDARLDVADAYDYYTSISEVLAERFLDALDNVSSYLGHSPEIFKTVEKGFLQAPFKVFPYVVLFKIHDARVVIFRVFRTSQDPKKRVSDRNF